MKRSGLFLYGVLSFKVKRLTKRHQTDELSPLLVYLLIKTIMKKKSRLNEIDDVEFKTIVETSNSIAEVLTKVGYKNKSGNMHNYIKDRIMYLGLSTKHMTKLNEKVSRNATTKIPIDEILVEDSTYTNRTSLKNRLKNEGILKYECKCGNRGEWLGRPMTLQLDHINGVNNDNRIENLRFICPNCHSQTSTFSGKNLK